MKTLFFICFILLSSCSVRTEIKENEIENYEVQMGDQMYTVGELIHIIEENDYVHQDCFETIEKLQNELDECAVVKPIHS